jgi:flagella basal body P-ring formation protein FlgA
MTLSNGIRLTLLFSTLCVALAVNAQTAPAASAVQSLPDFAKDTQRWLESAVAAADSPAANSASNASPSTPPLRMQVLVGALDSRLQLAPCTRIEPYLPTGTRLWGRTRIGLRCLEGVTKWNVFLPVTIKAIGRAWVLRANVNAGAVLSNADATEAEVDWAEDASPVVVDPSQWVGLLASRSLGAGQTLRQSGLRAATAFPAGTQVRVVAQGSGFSISTDAQALSAGVVGQSVRLRMEGGRTVTGQVLDARTVKLDL